MNKSLDDVAKSMAEFMWLDAGMIMPERWKEWKVDERYPLFGILGKDLREEALKFFKMRMAEEQ